MHDQHRYQNIALPRKNIYVENILAGFSPDWFPPSGLTFFGIMPEPDYTPAPNSPGGANWALPVQSSCALVMVGTVFSSILLPMTCALWFFSTSTSRRSVIFILNSLALVLGISEGFVNGYLQWHAILTPNTPVPPIAVYITGLFLVLTPFMVELILVLRLIAVFPPRTMSRKASAIVFTFPVLIKLARFINIVIYLSRWIKISHKGINPLNEAFLFMWSNLPNLKIEWTLQILDNAYASTLFMSRLRSSPRTFNGLVTVPLEVRLSSRLRGLFLIATSNFVIPCIFSFVQLVLVYSQPADLSMIYIVMVNDYVIIIGVVFATCWSVGSQWAITRGLASEHTPYTPPSIRNPSSADTCRSKPSTPIAEQYISNAPPIEIDLEVGIEEQSSPLTPIHFPSLVLPDFIPTPLDKRILDLPL